MEAEFSRRLERFDRNQGYVMTRSAEQVGCEALRDAEPILLEAARRLDARQLRYVTAQLRHWLDPDGSLKDANRDYERRHLYLSELLDGMFAIDGMLDAEGGSLLRSALDALMGPPERDDGRTTSQRRADALVEMAQRQLDQSELPQRGCQRPHLMLVAQTATLSSEPEAPAAGLESGQPALSPAESGEYLAQPGEGVPRSRGSTRRSRGRGPASRWVPARRF